MGFHGVTDIQPNLTSLLLSQVNIKQIAGIDLGLLYLENIGKYQCFFKATVVGFNGKIDGNLQQLVFHVGISGWQNTSGPSLPWQISGDPLRPQSKCGFLSGGM